MGVVIKQSGISSVFTYLGTIIGFANTVILFPAFLTTEEIGLIRAIPSAALMIMPLAQLGLGRTLLKFAPEANRSENGLAQLTGFILIWLLCGFVLTGIVTSTFKEGVFSLFAEKAPRFNDYLQVTIILILVQSLLTFFESYSKVFLKIIVLNIVREILIKLMMGIAVSLYFLKYVSFDHLIWGLILIYGIAVLCLIVYLIYLGKLKVSFRRSTLKSDMVKRIVNYSFYGLLGSGGGQIILYVDQVMVSSMLGLSENGVYTTAFFFAVMIELSRRALGQITTPIVSQLFEKNDLTGVKKIYQQVSINQMVIGMLFFCGIVCNMESVYLLMPNGDEFRLGYAVVIIIGVAKLIDMAFSINSEIITMSDHYKFNVTSMLILAGLMIYLNYILIPVFGIKGAALATLISLIIYNLVKMIFLKVKMGFYPFIPKTALLLLLGVLVFALGINIPRWNNPILDLLIRSGMITVCYCLPVYFLKISTEVNALVDKGIALLLKKR